MALGYACVCILSAVLSTSRTPTSPPEPPSQSAYQREVVTKIAQRAAAASSVATPKLLALMDSADFRSHLKTVAPHLADITSPDLLHRYRQEVATTEIIHNFPADVALMDDFNTVDVDLNMLMGKGAGAYNASYFINQWEIAHLFPNHTDRDTLMEWMVPAAATEMGMYQMKGFTGKNPFGISGEPLKPILSLLCHSLICNPKYMKGWVAGRRRLRRLRNVSCTHHSTNSAPT